MPATTRGVSRVTDTPFPSSQRINLVVKKPKPPEEPIPSIEGSQSKSSPPKRNAPASGKKKGRSKSKKKTVERPVAVKRTKPIFNKLSWSI